MITDHAMRGLTGVGARRRDAQKSKGAHGPARSKRLFAARGFAGRDFSVILPWLAGQVQAPRKDR
jgi:hypothetical protein